jgi:hypothetical protein
MLNNDDSELKDATRGVDLETNKKLVRTSTPPFPSILKNN